MPCCLALGARRALVALPDGLLLAGIQNLIKPNEERLIDEDCVNSLTESVPDSTRSTDDGPTGND